MQLHGRQSIVDRALQQSSIDSQLFIQNRDLCLPHLHSTPPLEYCHDVYYGKTRIVWPPDGKKILKICLFVLTEFMNVADEHYLTMYSAPATIVMVSL